MKSIIRVGENYHAYVLGKKPDEIFVNSAVIEKVCWAWFFSLNERELNDSPMWAFSAPANIGTLNILDDTQEWLEVYTSTIGRFVWEKYDDFFGPLYAKAGLENVFVSLKGYTYPILVTKPTQSNVKALYAERWMWDSLKLPDNLDYQAFKHLAAYHICWHCEKHNAHVPFYNYGWFPENLINKPELLDYVYSNDIAEVFWSGFKRKGYSQHDDAVRAVKEYTKYPIKNSRNDAPDFSILYPQLSWENI